MVSLVYGNMITGEELELAHEIHREMVTVLDHFLEHGQTVAGFGLGRIDYFPGLGPLNYIT